MAIEIHTIEPDSVRDLIIATLDTHATAAGYPFLAEPVAFEARDGERHLGGLTGKVLYGWLFVELLGVVEEARGTGAGRALLARAEDFARARCLTGLWLDTYGFQAPGFYERLGYTEFGRIPDMPPGQGRIFYLKRLDAEDP